MKAMGKVCPICDSKTTISPEDDEYLRCLNCGVIRTKHNYEASQYGDDYAHNYLAYAKSPINKSLNLFRLGLIARWLKSDAQILDVGCCVGEFLRFAEQHYYCRGFEPNEIAARIANKRTRSTIYTNLNGHLQYDCITMFDVIEHIQEPLDLLKHLESILRPGGIVAITTPEASAGAIGEGGLRTWKHWKPKEHLFIHTHKSLQILLQKAGLNLVHSGNEESKIRPGNPNGDILTVVAVKSSS
jgi:2-polyprenyl-3-methyl-5-hydroxy-6-metoxy-1,4-benzoquinol methylase